MERKGKERKISENDGGVHSTHAPPSLHVWQLRARKVLVRQEKNVLGTSDARHVHCIQC